MEPKPRQGIGRTALEVTRLGLGGAPLARPGDAAGPPPEASSSLIRRAFELGVRYFDTAPLYGLGESERRFGAALRDFPRDDIVVSTKVGRILDPAVRGGWRFDFSREAVQRSVESSLERLGLDRIDILYVHDADDHFEEACAGAFPALADLRAQGVVGAIGASMSSSSPGATPSSNRARWTSSFPTARSIRFRWLLAGPTTAAS